ncbi:MAG: cupin domain-containing protein [Acidobacteria bacterium]|nr:MAG: cupin domain-containing protein [Acidobacteriota bacterium]
MRPGLLGGLSPRAFLRRHWQKRPLLVRGALPGFRDPITPHGLLALAARGDVESRLVMERGGTGAWQVVPGPLAPARLRRLPPSHWTVLVQDVDAHVDAAADLIEEFDFLPRWRVDDVMVSLAAPRGSVGPHVDGYDVFLVQGRGRRRWRIARRFAETYHHGVALEECLTYSVGFRAPGHAELAAGFLQRVVMGVDQARRYADPDMAPARAPGEIALVAIARMRASVSAATAAVRGPDFTRFVGERLTEPRAEIPSWRRRTTAVEVTRRLRGGASLVRRRGARIGFVSRPDGGADLFADGRAWTLARAEAPAAAILSGARRLSADALRPLQARPPFAALLADLLSAGVFRLSPSRASAGARRRRRSRAAAGSSRTRARR